MGSTDQPRDSHGRFAPSGSTGNQPVKSFGGQPSVHTHLSAKAEKIALGKAQDQKRYPSRSDAEVSGMTAGGSVGLGKAQGSGSKFGAQLHGLPAPDPSKAADFLNTRNAMSAPRYRR